LSSLDSGGALSVTTVIIIDIRPYRPDKGLAAFATASPFSFFQAGFFRQVFSGRFFRQVQEREICW
jgi:hypothetical protein